MFALTDKNGHKLSDSIEKSIVKTIHDGVPTPRSLLPWRVGSARERVTPSGDVSSDSRQVTHNHS